MTDRPTGWPTGMPRFSYGRRSRTTLLVAVIGAAAVLLPWTGYLAVSLPDRFDTHQWRTAWVGFDVALLGCFAAAAWLGWHRHRATTPLLVATATLMCADAWFDVVLEWSGPGRWRSVLIALLVEVPGAVVLLHRTRVPLLGGMPARLVSPHEIGQMLQILTDPVCGQVTALLERAGTTGIAELSAASGLPPATVKSTLDRLAATGYARRTRAGRWRPVTQSLHWPDPRDVPEPDRERYRAFMTARYEREARLFGRAAREWDRLGPWGHGSRGGAHLTAAELARFNEEYLELLFRYSMLRDHPTKETREIALRFYAFPRSVLEEDATGDTA